MKTIRIGNGQGFWGDNVDAPIRLLRGGEIDYIGMDYLAEVTLSIMMRQKLKDPTKGYATDFVEFIREVLPDLKERGVRVLSNAGGLNPHACRTAILEAAKEMGLEGIRVGVVEGDDLQPRLSELVEAGHEMRNMEDGEPLAPLVEKVTSANAYLGARPVVDALEQGAQIVLCGRVTDTALALAPLIYEFGWGPEDWDLLAAGTIAGHILECGPQCTGGNFTRWWEVPDLWDVGYPVIEAKADGTFTVTKHDGTGGLVTVDTVSEQLLYEMGQPSMSTSRRTWWRISPPSSCARTATTGWPSPVSKDAPTRRSSKSRPRTWRVSRRPEPSPSPARGPSTKPTSAPTSCASASKGPVSPSTTATGSRKSSASVLVARGLQSAPGSAGSGLASGGARRRLRQGGTLRQGAGPAGDRRPPPASPALPADAPSRSASWPTGRPCWRGKKWNSTSE